MSHNTRQQTAYEVAELINADLAGERRFRDPQRLTRLLQDRFHATEGRAAVAASAIFQDRRGAAFYENTGTLARFLAYHFRASAEPPRQPAA